MDSNKLINQLDPDYNPQKGEQTQQKIQICSISENNEKFFLYYMPKQIAEKAQKIFHPCDWCASDFEIGRHLGKGTYGHVYLARQRRTKMIIALKVLSKKQIIKQDIVFQIRRQLQIHSHLNHPNILKMHGFFYDQKKIYIILDYAPRGQLYKILQKQAKFSQQKTAKYIYQIINALIYCHNMKIIHRDIKPQNILLSTKDQIKLTDFGWSIHLTDFKKRRNTLCGTPDYISPEIVLQKQYDYKVDLWCVGVLTYEFAAGFPPFHGSESRNQLMKKISMLDYKCPSHFSPELRDFVASFLRVNAKDRISLKQALQHPWIQKYYYQIEPFNNQNTKNNKNKNYFSKQQQKDVQFQI